MINPNATKQREKIWNEALRLSSGDDLSQCAVMELGEYYKKTPEEVSQILKSSTQLLMDEWKEMNINIKDAGSVENFYNNTKVEMFELMDWHVNRPDQGPLNYVCALEIAQNKRFNEYLDFGGGIGSGAILFAKYNFSATSADISNPLLSFSRYRFEKRGLPVRVVDLKKEELPGSAYDMITCFDVLEHLVRPNVAVRKLRHSLKAGGLLIVNNVDGAADDYRPMHISDLSLSRKLRSFGFEHDWELHKEFRKTCANPILVLKKVERPWYVNMLYSVYDHCPLWIMKSIRFVLGKR